MKASTTTYEYAQDHRLLKAEKKADNAVFEFTHDDNGQREFKRRNGRSVEAYSWLDFLRLAGFHGAEAGWRFHYAESERAPRAMEREDGAVAHLFYDQVGSLRLVADSSGRVIKEILYDPFGGIIEDTNPDLRIPIGYAGGLHDRDLGFVRFGWRDYDTFTGRWTAPDPVGDAGGDDDWYGYCLDDPVNMHDPLGLMGSKPGLPDESGVKKQYWKLQAEEGACDLCLELDGVIFMKKPGPVHPNCRCDAVEVWMTDDEAAPYKNWKPPLLMPKDSLEGRAARSYLRDKLRGFGDGVLAMPDKVVTPIQIWGQHRNNNESEE